jgi:hypothetical protein
MIALEKALLGEADILAGQVLCPRSTPDAIASFQGQIPSLDEWIQPNVCAYVPQTARLRNASIKGLHIVLYGCCGSQLLF